MRHLTLLAWLLPLLAAQRAGAQEISVLVEGASDAASATSFVPREGGDIAVDTGEVDSLGIRRPSSGRVVRWQKGRGAFFVWTFRATVRHGGRTARFELTATESQGRDLRYAVGTDTRWSNPDAGLPIPAGGVAVVHASLLDGEAVVFQVAMALKDSDRAGSFSPSIRYAAAVNGAAAPADALLEGARRIRDRTKLRAPRPAPRPAAPPTRRPYEP